MIDSIILSEEEQRNTDCHIQEEKMRPEQHIKKCTLCKAYFLPGFPEAVAAVREGRTYWFHCATCWSQFVRLEARKTVEPPAANSRE